MKPRPTFGYHERGDSRYDQLGALVELVAVTITEALRGPVCSKHRKLADLMKHGDIVFSYNYDILMDSALRGCQKLTDKGYLLDFYRVYNDAGWEEPQKEASPISILKLHGSMNWIRCSFCGSVLLLRRQKTGEWLTSVPNSCPRCKQPGYLERLLIPPLLNKNYTDRDMNYLWLEAQRSLSNIEEVVIIGYSLPPTDFASETLLRTGTLWATRKNLPVTIVDPDPKEEVKTRFSRIFNPNKIEMKASLDEYLDSV
jgi:NAD-dependent SIR2 family protein deacetylase